MRCFELAVIGKDKPHFGDVGKSEIGGHRKDWLIAKLRLGCISFSPVAELRASCDHPLMSIALVVLAAAVTPAEAAKPFDFSRGYVVWAGSDRGRCNYFMTDVGESAKQLTDTLRDHYPLSAGIEILTDKYTPVGCATIGVQVAHKAGFKHVCVRHGTDKDRSPGIT